MARSSSDQCAIGKPNSAGLVVARTRILCRSSGGKSPRSTAAREIGQTVEAAAGEAASPLADCSGVAVEFLGHLPIGRAVALATAKDEAAAKGLGLRGGVGVGDLLELVLFFAGEADEWGAAGHAASSLCQGSNPGNERSAMPTIESNPPGSLQPQVSHYPAGFMKRTTRSNSSIPSG